MQCARKLSRVLYTSQRAMSPARTFCAHSLLRTHRPRLLLSRDPHINTRWWRRSVSKSAFDRSQKRSPISWTSLLVLVVGGGVAVFYVKYLKTLKEKEIEEKKIRSHGKAALGGPFSLVDHNGERKEHSDFFGQWVLIYFGFTFCPDVCPEELEKITEAIKILEMTPGLPTIQPLFITVDPKRDSPDVIKKYLSEFHPRLLGLTGNKEEIERATKAYRVYYSIGPSDDPMDYLVDHTIIMYLVDPEGNFREYFGQNRTTEEISHSIANHMIQYQRN